jgi:hypothetical protein
MRSFSAESRELGVSRIPSSDRLKPEPQSSAAPGEAMMTWGDLRRQWESSL